MLSKVKQRTPEKTDVNVDHESYFAVHQSTIAWDAYILQINMIADKFFFEPVGASELEQVQPHRGSLDPPCGVPELPQGSEVVVDAHGGREGERTVTS